MHEKYEFGPCSDGEMWLFTDQAPVTRPKGFTLHSEAETLPREVTYLNMVQGLGAKSPLRVPRVLRECRALRSFAMPAGTASLVAPGELPAQLEEWVIRGHGEKCVIDSAVVLPRLERLVAPLVELRFEAASFPRLSYLALQDKNAGQFPQIRQLEKLKAIHFVKLQATARVAELTALDLEYLCLSKARPEAIAAVGEIKSLRSLVISEMRDVPSLDWIKSLTHLEEISFTYSQRLPSLAPLAHLPMLRGVRFLDCGPLQWDGLDEHFAARQIALDVFPASSRP